MRRGLIGGCLVVLAIAGCGGGDDTSSEASSATSTVSTSTTENSTTSGGAPEALGSKAAVQTAAEAVLTSSDPADACGKYVTERYLRVAFGGKQGCVHAQVPGSAAASLDSFRIIREGSQGTTVAAAVPNGGPYDGDKVEITLLFQGDHYAVDALHANVPVGP
jgi:hypothetical protein